MAVVQYKTPGVYVEELDAFPPSIVGVQTAVPVFIGYTVKAEKAGRSVKLRPVRITSMVDYTPIFGGAYKYQFTLKPMEPTKDDFKSADTAATAAEATQATAAANVAGATDPATAQKTADAAKENAEKLRATADKLKADYAKTDAGKADAKAVISEKEYADAQAKNPPPDAKTLADAKTKAETDRAEADRVAALAPDVRIGGRNYGLALDKKLLLYNSLRLFYENGGGDCYVVSVGSCDDAVQGGVLLDDLKNGLDAVRDLIGPTMLVIPEAMALDKDNYDKLVPAMLQQCFERQDRVALLDVPGTADPQSDFDVTVQNFRETVGGLHSQWLKYGMAYAPFLQTSIVDPGDVSFVNFDAGSTDELAAALTREVNQLYPDEEPATPSATGTPANGLSKKGEQLKEYYFGQIDTIGKMAPGDEQNRKFKQLNSSLVSQVPVFKDIYAQMAAKLGLLPPSPAMAGVYTQNDLLRGVWNAPANVGLVAVTSPAIRISTKMQDDLNMPIDGLAINAIRDFVGRGTLVWGARTLDGNSNDWRYIQVRRALIYIEQSVELALNKFVFEPNVAQTWVTVASMIGSFLRGVWQAGGLMGAAPTDAYSVQCGLGSTMTAQDVLEGRMIVQIKLTMVRPAEFIVLTFQQQMQGGA